MPVLYEGHLLREFGSVHCVIKCFFVRIVLSFAETGEDKIFSARGAGSIDFGYTTIKTHIIHKCRIYGSYLIHTHTHTHM